MLGFWETRSTPLLQFLPGPLWARVVAPERVVYIGQIELIISLGFMSYQPLYCWIDWGCRIHQLLLSRGVRPHNECPGYDTKQSDAQVPVMLEI